MGCLRTFGGREACFCCGLPLVLTHARGQPSVQDDARGLLEQVAFRSQLLPLLRRAAGLWPPVASTLDTDMESLVRCVELFRGLSLLRLVRGLAHPVAAGALQFTGVPGVLQPLVLTHVPLFFETHVALASRTPSQTERRGGTTFFGRSMSLGLTGQLAFCSCRLGFGAKTIPWRSGELSTPRGVPMK